MRTTMPPVARVSFRFSRRAIPFALAAALSTTAFAQDRVADLTAASLEDLMNIQITSASHKEQRIGETAAAVSVITQEDIRRSGMSTVPELLRLAPGVEVARINSNKWAVAVRGFNNLFADKLLVLVDGRTVYDRLNSGVFWESLDIPLDQIDRIEVIRGAGGATWGANAVNGVINIVTKSAAETPGAAVTVAAGTLDGPRVSARYGGVLGPVAYRVYAQWSGPGSSTLDSGSSAGDTWQSQTHGFRLDWTRAADSVMVEGNATLATLNGLWPPPSGPVPAVSEAFDPSTDTREYSVVGRWTRRLHDGASFQVQSFFDYRHNIDPVDPRQTTADIAAQYHATLWQRHDVVMGAGYRDLREKTLGGFSFSIAPSSVDETLTNGFIQDEIALERRLHLTLGAKVEHGTLTGANVQPTARVMWSPAPLHHVWAAVSRAVRTPSLGDVWGRYDYASFVGEQGLPVVVGALGNPDYRSEEVLDTEAGYRVDFGPAANVDVTFFAADYDRLRTNEPLAPRFEPTPLPAHLFIPVQFGNLLAATASGAEVAAHWTPFSWWRLDGGYAAFRLTPRLSAESADAAAASLDGNVPQSTWQARSGLLLGSSQLDVMVFHAGRLRTLGVPAYTRADVRFEVPVTRRLSIAAVGQNLLDPAHAEFAGPGAIVTPTLIPRSAQIQLRWRR